MSDMVMNTAPPCPNTEAGSPTCTIILPGLPQPGPGACYPPPANKQASGAGAGIGGGEGAAPAPPGLNSMASEGSEACSDMFLSQSLRASSNAADPGHVKNGDRESGPVGLLRV